MISKDNLIPERLTRNYYFWPPGKMSLEEGIYKYSIAYFLTTGFELIR